MMDIVRLVVSGLLGFVVLIALVYWLAKAISMGVYEMKKFYESQEKKGNKKNE